MKRRAFIGLGAASIAAGALHSTGAFDSLSAGRGIAVNATEDANGALLGIQNADDEANDPVFENNTPLNMKVGLNADSFTPSEFALSPGEERTVTIESDGGVSDVVITATLFDGGTSDQLFEDGTPKGEITLVRDFSDNIVFGIDGNIRPVGNRGDNSITFDIDTTGGNEATIDGYAVQTNVEDVSFDEREVEFDGGDLPVTFSSQIEVTISRFRGPGGGGSRPSNIIIENQDFVPVTDADIVVTLELAERDNVDLGIQATFD
ncbi:hypothetical protein [Natronobeatus ordinarius]|uniref:hypothetical protein n=1 Tax=Natronobeatus ordinarius TaxID=2963433 RepID=UPI0020CBA4B5|nr:hypothetical protein [Natronobeatus ordinarius]